MPNNANRLLATFVAPAFALMLVITAAAHAAEPRASPDAYGRLPALEDVVVSPNGSAVAFVKTVGEERYLLVLRLGESQFAGGTRIGDAKRIC